MIFICRVISFSSREYSSNGSQTRLCNTQYFVEIITAFTLTKSFVFVFVRGYIVNSVSLGVDEKKALTEATNGQFIYETQAKLEEILEQHYGQV